MEEVDYSKLTDREIDALIAERVMNQPKPVWASADYDDPGPSQIGYWRKGTTGYENGDTPIWVATPFSTDDNAARLMRNRIAELGLHGPFLQHLDFSAAFEGDGTIGFIQQCEWLRMQATPRQQCIAALLALEAHVH